MSAATAPPHDRLRASWEAYAARHPWALDAVLIAAVTLVAAIMRLVKLGAIPYGVHSDEAQVGTDAHRILSDGWIGVYTHAALGQPAGHAYLTTPSIWLLGDTAFALRLPLALVALAAIPLLYLLVRVSYARTEAFFASLLLALSYWHLFYSRVAHWSISYGTIVLAVLLCIMLGLRSGRWGWFAAAGALLGLGVYTYNIYPIAVVAVAVFIAIATYRIMRERPAAFAVQPDPAGERDAARAVRFSLPPKVWLRGVLVLGVCAFIVALPMLNYLRNPDAYYWAHFDNYGDVRITRTPEFRDADAWGKTKLIGEQLKFFASAYGWHGRKDIVDGNGIRPVFDPLTIVLLLTGLALAWPRRREPMVIAAACGLLIIPLPATLQSGSIMREPVAAAPYAMFFAALPLAALWRAALRRADAARWLPMGAVAVAVAIIGVITVHDYFWTLRKDGFIREIYFSEMTSASVYIRDLPPDAHVYFYSDRAPFGLETRQYLAPDASGEDRSIEFSDRNASIEDIDRTRPAVFVLLVPYQDLLPQIEEAYPGGRERVVSRDGKFEFAAYELAAGE